MSDNETKNGRPLRSARWFRKNDLPGFVHRSILSAAGWSREDLMERPVVGILNTWSDINPCNLNLRTLAEEARVGILEAGGIPFEVPLMSISENIIKPTSFPFRNLLAMEAEETIRGYPFDAVVLLGGCDKTQPALLMGAASAGVPFIFLASGPATPRSASGGNLANATGVWRLVDQLRAGELSEGDFAAFERSVMGTAGHCAEMGTASSMAVICEALGVSLPGSSLVPAVDRCRHQLAREVGRRSVRMAADGGPRPSEVLDARAFDNAITLLCAVGGSTNVIIHLLALAGRVGVPLTLDRFDEIARRVPLIANVQPAGEHLTERLMAAGGVPALLKTLEPLLHLDARTVDGRTVGAILETAEVFDSDVIRPLENPVKPGEAMVVVKGNLAPDGAVMKTCAANPKLFRHRGPAVVFEDVQTIADQIDNPELGIDENSVLILRNAGPVGAAMPEWGMLPLPRHLMERGVRDMLRISDARMSGTAYGAAVLHVSPEAAIGGPLALVRDGDIIELDVAARRLELCVEPDELERRRQAWQAPQSQHVRGYRNLYNQHIEQAHLGCDFDFLRGANADTLPEGLFDGWVGGW
ncbi:L-arabonate dehydratase [Cupriavidus taiwanensis]|uniref:dihydroxy-acid dehydratase n=1 Tax=Cupriavidus taiwanensis TaxID=164546 RepID=UPI000E13A4EB|nr:dihydroxy-acid dehydratase [Cupriavidus taiwanensis]SOY91628.1 L-arabonate dehydratase [Cupriavidus taiwanensis]SOY92457.1 L-arabonate dehydratase [Cupriavidus taiwanensis]